MATADKCIQSIRLSDQQVSAILNVLDSNEKDSQEELRKFKRNSFRTRKVLLHVLDGHHGLEASFRVVARNLSTDGMGFIHSQMLPPGKKVLIQIPRKGEDLLNVLARVAHCRHVKGMIHEVGLKFLGFGDRRHLAAAMLSAHPG